MRYRNHIIDTLKVMLTILVMVHHIPVFSAASGRWWLADFSLDSIRTLTFGIANAVNEAYIIGFFMFTAAYMAPGSVRKHGIRGYLFRRLRRLGLPFLGYVTIIHPMMYYLDVGWQRGRIDWSYIFETYFGVMTHFSSGHLWFVLVLLVLEVLYCGLLILQVRVPRIRKVTIRDILGFALLLTGVTFVSRIVVPWGTSEPVLGVQLYYLPQCVLMFAAGLIWAESADGLVLPRNGGLVWGSVSMILILLYATVLVGWASRLGETRSFFGGISWQALSYAAWEQFLNVSLNAAFFHAAMTRRTNLRLPPIVASITYGAYFISLPVMYSIRMVLSSWGPSTWRPTTVFGFYFMTMIPISFGLAYSATILVSRIAGRGTERR